MEIKEILFGTANVEKGVSSQVNVVLEDDASFFIEKSKYNQIVQNISFDNNIEAPIEEGAIIGEITFTLDNNVISKVNLVASDTVKKLNLVNMTTELYYIWFNLLRE